MATREEHEDHERAAAGMDYDSPVSEKASQLLLPESWRDHIRQFPVAALLLGFGVGVWLGMKKGNEVIAAGTTMASAAAMANVSKAMERFGGSDS